MLIKTVQRNENLNKINLLNELRAVDMFKIKFFIDISDMGLKLLIYVIVLLNCISITVIIINSESLTDTFEKVSDLP